MSEHDIAVLVSPDWDVRNQNLEGAFLPWPPLDFLQHPDLYAMFVSRKHVQPELPFVKTSRPGRSHHLVV